MSAPKSNVEWGVLPPPRIYNLNSNTKSIRNSDMDDSQMEVEVKSGDGELHTTSSSLIDDDAPDSKQTSPAKSQSKKNLDNVRIRGNTAEVQTSLIKAKGPLPINSILETTRKWNDNILRRLVFQRAPSVKKIEMENYRNCVTVSARTKLPSAMCYTIINAHNDVNGINISNDATHMVTSMQDSSIHVWRVDGGEIGYLNDPYDTNDPSRYVFNLN